MRPTGPARASAPVQGRNASSVDASVNRQSDAGGSARGPAVGGRLAAAWIGPGLALTILAALHTSLTGWGGDLDVFMWGQDLVVFAGVGALFLTLAGLRRSGGALETAAAATRPRSWILLLAGVTLAAGWLGYRLVFEGYAFSRDEHLALFDARIFAGGHLMAEVPQQWRSYVPALEPMFMLQTPGHRFWASGYLPVNAALQAIGVATGLKGLISPLLAGLAVVSTWAVGRRLWPDRPNAALIAALLLATSSQFLVTAMTPYAMTAHLALNMSWLWLFLRGGRLGHAGAILTGFLACGLHQLIFHPLFVAPFILQLWLDRRWRMAAGYTLAYAGICLFWTLYWPLMMSFVGVARETAAAYGTGHYAQQAVDMVRVFDISGLGVMAKNLVRFMTWQNPLTVPLVVLAAVPAIRAGGVLRSLVLGMVLTTVAMTLLLPVQLHGWGYRYLHGFLGSAALVAAWGWGRLTERLDPARGRDAGMLFATCTAAAIAILLPLRAWQAHEFIHPFAQASRAIAQIPAEVVLVDNVNAWRGIRLVRNEPNLARPLTLPLAALTEAQIQDLCAGHKVAVFSASDIARQGVRLETWEIRRMEAARSQGGDRAGQFDTKACVPEAAERPSP